ncbi:tetratricopeptide repeat protein [Niabella hibiscisoli]|uniref:tetratricopeptide repeat protein n=1 Tax=Niabella hibiscisoli TaxID=1825928 RepID=UPI001F0D1C78|nr:tetratricopeptide repeat protein [Niabella hibiscisoli]MCH5718594.1 tetratricopeptide repeat protein [Niabella hibiscisoli]
MKYISCLLALLLNCFWGTQAMAQDADAFNKIYQRAFLEVAPSSIDSAHFIADSLYGVSTTPLFKTRSLMLSATLYQQQQQLEKATQTAEQAFDIIIPTDHVDWQVRICGFLATQYRTLRLYKKSKAFCERALALIPQIQQPGAAHSAAGLVNQELAYAAMSVNRYEAAINHIRSSQQHFDQITQNKKFFTAENEQLLGLNYFKLNQPDKALQHYAKSLALLKDMPDNHIHGLAYNGISAVYIHQGKLPDAKNTWIAPMPWRRSHNTCN